jgi:MoxR-like ATPase
MQEKLDDIQLAAQVHKGYNDIKKELAKVIVGQDEILDQLLIALFSQGHCLLVGVPGLAKTLIIQSLAQTLDMDFSRIQFTPDLMPSDISGSEILEDDRSTGQKSYRFIKGPVFSNIVLADEINRTPPKTQSALLEAMQEYNVTAAGETYALDMPFFVLATQNPIEQEGTYPLPEAQLDRFMFNLWLDYPKFEEEVEVIKRTTGVKPQQLSTIISKKQILQFQDLIRRTPVADNIVDSVVKLISSTRANSEFSDEHIKEWIRWGAGPRASQYLILGAKTRAILQNRYTPNMDDIRALALPVLRHRLVMSYRAEAEGMSVEKIIEYILDKNIV